MSDLHRAIRDEIDAFTPDRTPPLAAIRDRKRTRDRRILAGAALSAVAASGIALASTSLGGAPDTTTPVADGSTTLPTSAEPVVFDVRPASPLNIDAPGFGVGVEDCVRLPGTSNLSEYASTPASFQVTVTGPEAVQAFRSCLDRVVGYQARPATEIKAPSPIPVPLEPTGAQVCLREQDCASLAEPVARDLAEALRREARRVDGPVCLLGDVQYTVTFVDRFKQHPAVQVPSVGSCAPVTVGSQAFTVPDVVKEQIGKAHQDAAGAGPELLDQCLGTQSGIEQTSQYNGLPEAEALAQPLVEGEDRRVVARDGQCLGMDSDQRPGRANLVVEDGRVAGAAVERLAAAPVACESTSSYLTGAETQGGRYTTPNSAADAYRSWQQSIDDLAITVPDRAESGYAVTTDLVGTVAVLRAGDVELDAVSDDGAWRIVRIRACAP